MKGGLGAELRSAALIAAVVGVGGALVAWKVASDQGAQAAAASQQEPIEAVTAAVAAPKEYRSTTTSIGTVLATQSVSLRNEVPGTVARTTLVPGAVVDQGDVLVALDVSVEQAELTAQEARAELARTTLGRYERMAERQAASAIELDNARAERDVAVAEVARTKAIIERKTIRAPFRARVGISDVHPGQFLEAGTLLTTLQGVAEAVDVDFAVTQAVAAGLSAGMVVRVSAGQEDTTSVGARISAVDARVDPATRNAMVRARIRRAGTRFTPGASVRVVVPVGGAESVVVVPVSGLRQGPEGDHVFILDASEDGRVRAHLRPVRTGPVLGDEVVVLSGVEAGERVATSGSFKLRDGVLVNVADEGGVGSAASREEGASRSGDENGSDAGVASARGEG